MKCFHIFLFKLAKFLLSSFHLVCLCAVCLYIYIYIYIAFSLCGAQEKHLFIMESESVLCSHMYRVALLEQSHKSLHICVCLVLGNTHVYSLPLLLSNPLVVLLLGLFQFLSLSIFVFFFFLLLLVAARANSACAGLAYKACSATWVLAFDVGAASRTLLSHTEITIAASPRHDGVAIRFFLPCWNLSHKMAASTWQ